MTTALSSPSALALSRGVTEVLHFTTSRGLIGILSKGAVLSRDALEAEGTLEPIRLLNCLDRSKDAAWTNYVNLSLTDVNAHMLNHSRSWHREDEVWWAVLAFDVSVLDESGVWFTTTNNTYSAAVRRSQGVAGLADLFTEPIEWGYYGSTKRRYGRAANQPTCEQAEVLYPVSLPLTKLTGVYVAEGAHTDDVAGWVATFPATPTVPVTINPSVFK